MSSGKALQAELVASAKAQGRECTLPNLESLGPEQVEKEGRGLLAGRSCVFYSRSKFAGFLSK